MADPDLRFGVLGDLEIHVGDRRVDLGGARIRTLMAALLLHPSRPVTMDRLLVSIWPTPPASATANLRTYATTLRRRLDSVAPGASARLQTTANGYLFAVGPGELDMLRFEELAAQGTQLSAQGDLSGAACSLGRAIGLWRGQPLSDLRYGPTLAARIVWLQERYLAAVAGAVDAWQATGRQDRVISETVHVLAAFPLHEPLWAQLMLALYQSGRRADALAAYRRAREYLIEEIGLEPGAELRRVHQSILSWDPVAPAAAQRLA